MSFLVVFCNVTVACFSASFNVLTGILLQLKQLYFTSLVLDLFHGLFSFLIYTHILEFNCLSEITPTILVNYSIQCVLRIY